MDLSKMNLSQSIAKQLLVGCLVFGQAGILLAQKSPADVRVLAENDRAAIAAAMPSALQTQAIKPRKLLVMSRSMGYYHKSTPMGNAFFEQVQSKYHGYTFDFSDSQEDYSADKLQQYDALIFNNCTGLEKNITDPAIRQGIIDFVQQGGGLMIIHGAADAGSHGWAAYNDMIGFRFAGHPWGAGQVHCCINEDTEHPLTEDFEATFRIKDELYVSSDPFFSRDKVRVLLSVNLSDVETASKLKQEGQRKRQRSDQDYTVSHVREFGQGRVFYTTFGHNDSVYKETRVQTHYLGGLQYVSGDLEAEDLPIPLYVRLQAFKGPLFFEAKLKLFAMARHARTAEEKQQLTDLCSRLIRNEQATDASRQAAIEALSLVATPASFETVAGVLNETALAHPALMFLSQHADADTFMQLSKQAWSSLNEQSRIKVIQAMGARGAAFADPLMTFAAQGADTQRIAAIRALGHCATQAQVDGLLGLTNAPGIAEARAIALIDIANRLAPTNAYPIYQRCINNHTDTPLRAAALVGLVRLNPATGEPLVLQYLSDDNAAMRQAAIAASHYVNSEALTVAMGALAVEVSEWDAICLIQTLARRGDAQVLPVLEQLIANPATQLEAIDMLGAVDGVSQVAVLSELLSDSNPDVAKAAEGALINLRAEGADEAIAQQLLLGASNQQMALLKVADGRRTAVLAAVSATLLRSDDAAVANAALKVVVLSGTIAELETLCALALEQSENSRIGSGIAKLCGRLHDDTAVASILIDSAQRATPEGKVSFIKILRKFPSTVSETYLLSQLESGSPELQLVVVPALAEFDSDASKQALLLLCKNGRTAAIKDAAFNGYAQLLKNDQRLAPSVKLSALSGLLQVARTNDQRIVILDTLAGLPDPGVEALAAAYLKDSNGDVAEAAASAISGSLELLSKADWTFSSNFNDSAKEHQKMIDLDSTTRWTSKAMMSNSDPMWIVVDLGYEQAVKSVTLDTTGSAGDFPRTYELYVSKQSNEFGAPVATGTGTALTVITCDAFGRYVKIVQTAKQGPYWSIHALKINGRPSGAKK
ncbi:Unannotated [Lentimonas sp. CC4]|nr:Unannotated [Lentimonas sp. CC4]CAA6683925.1 Unannotated [Lentimonas sp. CC6]CAA7076697.1 Unannotated [Lentimonas sp. CC4]CAA7169969.1 Unannotated [Lentimonas sp. CC21]CAA7181258.1 Unannotated [Lentimonas sp. CC8]